MPLVCMNREVGYNIGVSIGRVEEVDVNEEGVGWGTHLRIKVAIDFSMPLDKDRALKMRGKTISISFSYENLPKFCFLCGQIRHGRKVVLGYTPNEKMMKAKKSCMVLTWE
jgi:hypothetical protein